MFMNCTRVQITELPDNIEEIIGFAFASCSNVKISKFGSDSSQGSRLRRINGSAFYDAGRGDVGPDVTSIYIHRNVEFIGPSAFYNYGGDTLQNVYLAREESFYEDHENNNYMLSQSGLQRPGVSITYNYSEV